MAIRARPGQFAFSPKPRRLKDRFSRLKRPTQMAWKAE